MATHRKTFTKPLSAGEEIFIRKGERFARWKDGRGKTRTAPLTTGSDGSDRIVGEAGTYTAKYRDGLRLPNLRGQTCLVTGARRTERGHGLCQRELAAYPDHSGCRAGGCGRPETRCAV